MKLTAPAEGLEPPSSWFEARCLSVRPRGRGVPGEIRTRASWLRTRPPGPLVRRGHGELGGTRTLFRRFAANVPRLRTSSGVRPAGVEPALPAWHAGVHPVTPRPQTRFGTPSWNRTTESRIWSSFGRHALRRIRRLVRESNPSPEIDNLLAYPAASRGKVARSCVKARSPAATEVAKGAQLRAVQENFLGKLREVTESRASSWDRTNTSGTSDRRFHQVSFRCMGTACGYRSRSSTLKE